jgi:hypothetical protein
LLKGYKPSEILTSHYPRYEGQAAIDFLDLSLNYTDLIESICLEVIGAAQKPIGMMELIELTHERMGPWADPAYKYLAYPVLGHLEVLLSYQKIKASKDAKGLTQYQIAK